ncbi:inositol phosphate phosphatase SopB, partial [Vibrio anguillarum]
MIYPSFLFSSSISGIGCQAIKKNNNSFSKQVKKVKRLKKRKNKNSSHDFSKPFYRTFLIETAIKAINESQGILKNKERRIKILQESLPEEEQCLPLEEEAEMIKATENKIEKTLKIDNSFRNRLRKKDVKLMKKKWKREKLSMLNKTKHSWVILKNNITTPTGETYNNIMTPAGKMKLGDSDIFSHSYNDEGISSGSICESEHAVNLWMSELTSTSGDVLFKGIRHGVLSPYGLDKNSQERKVGRVNRGKEVILAALYANQAILESAIQNPDEVVPLQLTSTSLVTAGNVWSVTEGDQLEDQIYSWNELSNKVIELEVVDKSGNCQKIKVKPEIIPFNFGVNELSLKFKIGQKKSDSINLEGLKILLGDGFCNSTDPQGWVGKYLADNPKNKSVVLQLVQQIKEIWEAKAHNTDESDPYKMARCIVLL